jgi:multiple sugar transport system permease protein
VLGQLVTASLAGYAFAHLAFPGKNILFYLILATIMIPLQATIIPVFILISHLGLSDTLFSLILPALPTAFGTFLLRQYFLGIPKEYEESALIDGANQWQIFFRVYFPLATPGLAILAVLTFNYHWNEFFRPLIFLNTKERFTIPLGLFDLQGYMMTGSISVVLAGIVLSLIPVIIIYIFGQRYLIEGIMAGGLKG